MKFTFTTKEEYLAYRSEWKAKYAQLSKSIRIHRLYCKENSRVWNKAMQMAGATHGYHQQIIKAFDILKDLQAKPSDHHKHLKAFVDSPEFVKDAGWNGSKVATEMLEELKEAKLEANRQYLAAKQKVA